MKRNIEARSCGKSASITYFDGAFVALGMQHSKSLRHVVICGLSGSATFFLRYLKNGTIFEINVLNMTCLVLFLYNFYPKHFSF